MLQSCFLQLILGSDRHGSYGRRWHPSHRRRISVRLVSK